MHFPREHLDHRFVQSFRGLILILIINELRKLVFICHITDLTKRYRHSCFSDKKILVPGDNAPLLYEPSC